MNFSANQNVAHVSPSYCPEVSSNRQLRKFDIGVIHDPLGATLAARQAPNEADPQEQQSWPCTPPQNPVN
jgi:hypothetical protein